MLPLRDDVPSRTAPFVTVLLIAVNAIVYLYQTLLALGDDPGARQAWQQLIAEFGSVPCRLAGTCPAGDVLPDPVLTIFTSMFLHGGLFHVGGNMLYLWIFGNNVEDALGHGRFAAFYLLAGVAGALAQTGVDPASAIPMVGASGAVSGVLGAYLLLFPYARVLVLFMIGFFWRCVHVPALIVLGFWIVVQIINGVVVGSAAAGDEGGVAWFAHVGGFAAGVALLFVLRPRRAARL